MWNKILSYRNCNALISTKLNKSFNKPFKIKVNIIFEIPQTHIFLIVKDLISSFNLKLNFSNQYCISASDFSTNDDVYQGLNLIRKLLTQIADFTKTIEVFIVSRQLTNVSKVDSSICKKCIIGFQKPLFYGYS